MQKLAAIALGAAILLAGLIFFATQRDFTFRFTESDIQGQLADRLPFTKRYLFIFDVTIDEPRVDLVDGSERVTAGADLLLNIRIGESDIPLNGAVDVSGEVDYQSADGSFYLVNPVIESLSIDGLPDSYADKSREVVEAAMSEFYRNRPIYRLEGSNAKNAGRMLLKDVTVENEELVVTLGLRKNEGN